MGGCRRRRKNITIHIELLVGGLGADAKVRSKLTSANVAIGCTIASKVGGGKRVRHETKIASSSAAGHITTELCGTTVAIVYINPAGICATI